MLGSSTAWLIAGVFVCFGSGTKGDVLIVADEFPAMETLAKRLKTEENRASQLVDQAHLPASLAPFDAVVVYIHKELTPAAEQTFIGYANAGGRLVLLHHSISSGKRQNRDWFNFLGVALPEGDLDHGGYKWIEGVTVQCLNLGPNQFIMTNQVRYPDQIVIAQPDGTSRPVPGFTLHATEVYLNHNLTGPRTVLMGLIYSDAKTGKTWKQETAGWLRRTGKGTVVYFMPGTRSMILKMRFMGGS